MFFDRSAPTPISDAVLDAAMALAAEGDWSSVSFVDIAVRAGIGISDIYASVSCKSAIIDAVSRRADAAVLAGRLADQADSPHDRLFEVLMRRFDTLTPYRDGLRSVARALRYDPVGALRMASRLRHSMAWMLEAARLPSTGATGALQVRAVGAVWLGVLDTWFKDDSADLTQTMAALDSALRRAESVLNSVGRGFVKDVPPSPTN